MTMRLAVKVFGMLAGLCLTLGASVAHAVPALQVYVEGAVYDSVAETWVLDTTSASGTVTITATTQNGNSKLKPLSGVQMVVSALDDDSFGASLTGGDGNLNLLSFSVGGSSPLLNGGDANSAASYLSFGLGTFGGNAEATFDYNDPDAGGSSSGNSQSYVLTLTDLTGTVIIDAYGFDGKKLVFAPYSHNGAITIVSDVPELSATGTAPAATLLLGALALLHARRRRTLA